MEEKTTFEGPINPEDYIGKEYITRYGRHFIIKKILPMANVSMVPEEYCYPDGMIMAAEDQHEKTVPLSFIVEGHTRWMEITDKIRPAVMEALKHTESFGKLSFGNILDDELDKLKRIQQKPALPEECHKEVKKDPSEPIPEVGEQLKLF